MNIAQAHCWASAARHILPCCIYRKSAQLGVDGVIRRVWLVEARALRHVRRDNLLQTLPSQLPELHFASTLLGHHATSTCKGRASAAAPATTPSQSAAWSRASRWPPRRRWSGRCTRGMPGCCSPAAPWRSCRAGQPRCRHARVRAACALNNQCHLCKATPAGMGGSELACAVLGGSAGRGPHATMMILQLLP